MELFIGRFQPFHKGHLSVLKSLSSPVIFIGSENKKRERENPFTFQERKEMIEKTLEKEKIRAEILGIPDFENDDVWRRKIEEEIPAFDVVVSGNPDVREIFRKKGHEVSAPEFYKKEKINGTRIRKLMRDRKTWTHLVPSSVSKYIKEKNLEKMVQYL